MFTETVELSDPLIIAKYGSFYDTTKFHNTSGMIFNSLFMIRRVLFVIFINMNIFSVRIGLLVSLQVAWITYLVLKRPLEDNIMMNLEIINEVIFYLALFVLPLFTELMVSAEDRYYMGFIMLGFLGLLVVCNLIAAIIKVAVKILEKRKIKREAQEKEQYLLDLPNTPKQRVWCKFCIELNLHNIPP